MSLALDNYVGLSENATKFHGLSSFSSLSHKRCHEMDKWDMSQFLTNPYCKTHIWCCQILKGMGIVQELEIPLGGHT